MPTVCRDFEGDYFYPECPHAAEDSEFIDLGNKCGHPNASTKIVVMPLCSILCHFGWCPNE
jgi:hypothetical protein